ncbi:glycoside hydrolase family 28 protein [Nocardioides panzhihuensis]|uniref:Polygalacturonase n=1 Tax=Nocardioides panzhihuensis TaxID=860243 RepID=A0A7Z0DNQ5_9ACTN|nr:glycosyl hydrolase family 28 protein [Nocardioides panzhihuensis]NYI78582.1 polygalacturonase [Nocardioides panzhihuensis]
MKRLLATLTSSLFAVGVMAVPAMAAGPKDPDGIYWDQQRYDEIERTVYDHVPTFPERRCVVTAADYAANVRQAQEVYAVGNAAGDPAETDSPLVHESRRVWFYGDAINAAIKDCHRAGGGTVVVPAGGSRNADGAYYSGAINLLSNVNLRIEPDAVVRFMRNKTNEFYPVVRTSYEGTDLYSFSPLIYAFRQRNIAVSGGGLLDGQEDMWNWRPWKKGYWGERSVEDRSLDADYGQQGILNAMNFQDVPFEERIFSDDGHIPETIPVWRDGKVQQVAPPEDAEALASTFRPSFVQPYESENVLIEDVRIRNTPFWVVHPVSSKNVLIRGLDIYSNKTRDFESRGWNNDDGIDPESSQNVIMEDNRVIVSDDGAAIKAGRNVNGREHRRPSEGIIIRDSYFGNDGGGSAAVSMGSEMSGGIRDVFIHDNRFGGPGLSLLLKIKTNSNRGGYVENIYVRDSVLERAIVGLVEFDANYRETVPFANTDVFDPKIRNIFIDNVRTTAAMPHGKTTFNFPSAATRSPVENVYYRDSVFHSSSTLLAGFRTNKLIDDLVVEDVTYVDPATGGKTNYDTTPLPLSGETVAVAPDGTRTPLTVADFEKPDHVTALPGDTFTVTGRIDLSEHPGFAENGQVKVYVDRRTDPVPVAVEPDGSFRSGEITLDDDQPWYVDRHYVSVNVHDGLDITTKVFHVSTS